MIIFRLSILALIIIPPFTLLKNRYTEQDSAVHYFFNVVEEATSPLISHALIWTLNTQPRVQVLGATLQQKLDLVTKFTNNKAIFEVLDERVLGQTFVEPSTEFMSDIPLKQVYPLIIHSNVGEATIRVMNIRPGYFPGMKLAPGSYDIEVSAHGYKTERHWIELTPEANEFTINLGR